MHFDRSEFYDLSLVSVSKIHQHRRAASVVHNSMASSCRVLHLFSTTNQYACFMLITIEADFLVLASLTLTQQHLRYQRSFDDNVSGRENGFQIFVWRLIHQNLFQSAFFAYNLKLLIIHSNRLKYFYFLWPHSVQKIPFSLDEKDMDFRLIDFVNENTEIFTKICASNLF